MLFRWTAIKFAVVAFVLVVQLHNSSAWATIRIAEYNTDISDTGVINPPASMISVLQAMGNIHLGDGIAQPLDVIALTELSGGTTSTTGNTTLTLQSFVSQLNAIYGAGTYAYDALIGQTDNTSSDGPSGLVYNTHTITDLGSVGIGAVGTTIAPRQPMRYLLQPVGYGSDADFYLYVDHYKAGTAATDKTRRNIEATEVRADADALGPNTHIIYSGDFNLSTGAEAAYQTLIAAGNGQAEDPANPAENWTSSATFKNLWSTSTSSLGSRYDFELSSTAVDPANSMAGLQLVSNSFTVFGNNGTTASGASTNLPTNTSLNDLGANASTILADLAAASDHMPVVADYNEVGVNIPEPTAPLVLLGASVIGLGIRRPRTQCVWRSRK